MFSCKKLSRENKYFYNNQCGIKKGDTMKYPLHDELKSLNDNKMPAKPEVIPMINEVMKLLLYFKENCNILFQYNNEMRNRNEY